MLEQLRKQVYEANMELPRPILKTNIPPNFPSPALQIPPFVVSWIEKEELSCPCKQKSWQPTCFW